MKKNLFVLFLYLVPFMLSAQAPFPGADEIRQFLTSKTCVVLEDDTFSPFNAYIKKAVAEFWKITPFEFIKTSEFNVRRSDTTFSFIVMTETKFEKDQSHSVFSFLNLLQGKDVKRIGEMPEICAIPLALADEEDLEYGYKLGAILLFMQKHASMISEDPSLTGRRYLRYYNKNVPQVVDKTILVKQEDLSPSISTIDKIKAIYSHSIEIVPEDSIIAAIKEKKPNTLILHKVGPVGERNSGYCFKMLIGTDNSDMYYYNQHTIDKANPSGLLPSDLKRLARF